MRARHLWLLAAVLIVGCVAQKSSHDAGALAKTSAEEEKLDVLISEIPSDAAQNSASGPMTEMPEPITASELDAVGAHLAQNWNLGTLAGSREIKGKIAEIRISLSPIGAVTNVVWLNENDDVILRQIAESCMRAAEAASPLPLLRGKHFSSIKVRCDPEYID